MKKGVSLVALVITIIVMIILTTAVILSVSEGGIIERARYAKYKSDWSTFQDDLTRKLLDDRMKFEYDGPVNVIYEENPAGHYTRMKEQIASFTEEYKDVFEIRDDVVVEIQHVEPVEEVVGDINEWETKDNRDGTLTITRYIGTKTSDITVPNTLVINGEKVSVTHVGVNTFSSLPVFADKDITGTLTISGGLMLCGNSVKDEDGITKVVIGEYCTVAGYFSRTAEGIIHAPFYHCSGIIDVDIKNNVRVGDGAFINCNSIKNIKTGNNVVLQNSSFINNAYFSNNDIYSSSPSPVENLIMGDNCSGWNIFGKADMSNVKSVEIGDDFRICMMNVFSERRFPSTAKVEIGSMSIWNYDTEDARVDQIFCFYEVDDINVTLNESFTKVPNYTFYKCGSDINSKIIIKGMLTDVGYYAFTNNLAVKRVGFSNAKIGFMAFEGCTNLTSVDGTISKLDMSAFKDCTNLNGNITILDGAKIDQDAFNGCTNLEKITIEGTPSYIGRRCFENCNAQIIVDTVEVKNMINSKNNPDPNIIVKQ